MNYLLNIHVLILFLTFVLSCKSKTPEPVKVSCPDGFWKVPDGWKCIREYGDKTVNCANDDQCMNYAHLCDNKINLKRRDNQDNSDIYYRNGWAEPDEKFCTDEFCSTLTDGRTRRCPGMTRCITPVVNYYSGTDVPIGPICSEVTYILVSLYEQCKNTK